MVLAAGLPTLKRWAIVACPSGTGIPLGKGSGRAELELCAPPPLTHNTHGHSNGLGAGFGGGGLALATRSKRLERAAGGFCHERSTSFMASSIRSRTVPLA